MPPSPEPKRLCGVAAMISHPRPLIGVFAEMPDFRSARGHPLAVLLALTCSAMLCGARSYTAIAEWGSDYGARLIQALGFTRRPPCPRRSTPFCGGWTGRRWKSSWRHGLRVYGYLETLIHLRQRGLRLGEPEGHLHGSEQLHSAAQRSMGLLPPSHRGIEPPNPC